MKLTLSPTSQIETHEGMLVRIWQGHSDSGIPVVAAIAFVGAAEGHNHADFDRELTGMAPPEIAGILPRPLPAKAKP